MWFWLQLVYWFWLGAALGSFVNVCIIRLPRHESVIRPGSRCMSCQTPIRFYDNIPLISYLVLRGKCRSCGAQFSGRYLWIELLCGFLTVLLYGYFGFGILMIAYLVFFLLLTVISVIDIDTGYIPSAVVAAGGVLGVAFRLVLRDLQVLDWTGAAIGGFVLMILLNYAGKLLFKSDGMGPGDAILALMMGVYLGAENLIISIVIGSVLVALTGLLMIIRKKPLRGATVPFGPYLSIGAVVAVFWGEEIIQWYLNYINM